MSGEAVLQARTVQETMLIPLWGRASFSKQYPELLDDPQSAEIIERVDYDFGGIARTMGEYGGLAYLVRGRRFDDAIKTYIAGRPQATVVNLGAGLDTTFSRVDNGRIEWVDLDLPDAIAFRQRYIPQMERNTFIGRSAFDHRWLDEVPFTRGKGIFVIAGGLFMYYGEAQVRDLLAAMATRFPGGQVFFDSMSKLGRALVNHRLKGTGAPPMQFALGNTKEQIAAWSNRLKVIETLPLWHGVERDSRWSRVTRWMINMNDWFKTGQFVRVRFMAADEMPLV
jgi:O-methyltransferase involved in polyketide biosynthesis